jgi:hypothetical protein
MDTETAVMKITDFMKQARKDGETVTILTSSRNLLQLNSQEKELEEEN